MNHSAFQGSSMAMRQCAHSAADKSPHNGDQGGQGDQDAHQQGVGHPEDGHGRDEQRAQNAGLRHWPERKLEKVRPDSRRTSSVRSACRRGSRP